MGAHDEKKKQQVPAFPHECVKDLFENPEKTFSFNPDSNWRPPCVFMAIDPSGLGRNSEFAIMSFFYTPQGRMVVSVDHSRSLRSHSSRTEAWTKKPETLWGGELTRLS